MFNSRAHLLLAQFRIAAEIKNNYQSHKTYLTTKYPEKEKTVSVLF
jgi:hypothetical protein